MPRKRRLRKNEKPRLIKSKTTRPERANRIRREPVKKEKSVVQEAPD